MRNEEAIDTIANDEFDTLNYFKDMKAITLYVSCKEYLSMIEDFDQSEKSFYINKLKCQKLFG